MLNTNGMLTSVPATNGSTTFSVTFSPTDLAAPTNLRVVSDYEDEGTVDITLTRTGSAGSPIVLSPTSADIALTSAVLVAQCAG